MAHMEGGLCSLKSFPYFSFIFTLRLEDSDPVWLTGRKTQSVVLGHWQFGTTDKVSKAGRVYNFRIKEKRSGKVSKANKVN